LSAQAAFDSCLHSIHHIAFQAHEEGLGLGVTEANIIFNKPWPSASIDHKTCVKKTAIFNTHLTKSLQGRNEDFLHYPLFHSFRDHGRGAVSTHATGIRPLIPVTDLFVILGRIKRKDGFSIHKGKKRGLFSLQKILDDYLSPGLAENAFS